MRTYQKPDGQLKINADCGPRGTAILKREGYMTDETPQTPAPKRKITGLTNEEKINLAAQLQRHLKTLHPELTIQDLCKVASTFYCAVLKQKKQS